MRAVTMDDLDDGTRIFHPRGNMTGTIRFMGVATEIRWDDCFVHVEVSKDGPVFPEDLEIIGSAR